MAVGTSTWFIPFALALTLLTAPLSVRDPVVMAPILVAATAFAAYSLGLDGTRGGYGAFLTAQVVLLGVWASGMVALALVQLR